MNARILAVLCASTVFLAACGGTKLVKNAPPPPQPTQPLAAAGDATVDASLQWVIVRNGPGAWARNADWDEYLLHVRNRSDAPIVVTSVAVTNSLDHAAAPLGQRKALVKASKRVARDYRRAGVKVQAGAGSAGMIAAGVGATTLGVGIATAQATASLMGGTAAAGGASAVAGGLILGGPILVGAGIVRAVRNAKVNNRIEQRSTGLPLTVAPGEALPIDLFFPLAPSPTRVRVTYRDATGEHALDLDTTTALAGLHLTPASGTGAAAAAR
jgi:hypothetical protein